MVKVGQMAKSVFTHTDMIVLRYFKHQEPPYFGPKGGSKPTRLVAFATKSARNSQNKNLKPRVGSNRVSGCRQQLIPTERKSSSI